PRDRASISFCDHRKKRHFMPKDGTLRERSVPGKGERHAETKRARKELDEGVHLPVESSSVLRFALVHPVTMHPVPFRRLAIPPQTIRALHVSVFFPGPFGTSVDRTSAGTGSRTADQGPPADRTRAVARTAARQPEAARRRVRAQPPRRA